MRALISPGFGGLDELEVRDIKSEQPEAREVLVSVKAAGLNFFDTLIIENKYQTKPEPPFSPGAEFCGTISALGGNVTDLKIGDRVAGYIPFGACREEIVVPSNKVVTVPDAVSDYQAAGVMVTYGTTIYGLRDRGGLQRGETLAVLGASGGVGLAAVELGKAMGAKVIACASSDKKLQICKDHGADILINYADRDLKHALKDATDGNGVDVVYDAVGGKYAEPAIRATAWNGRYLVIGFAAGDIPKIPTNLCLLKSMSIVGVFWGAFTDRQPEDHHKNMEDLLDLVAREKLTVHIGGSYPLEQAKQAIADLQARKAVGKLIVDMEL